MEPAPAFLGPQHPGMASIGGAPTTQLHGQDLGFDRAFDINDPCFSTDQFRMYEFKVWSSWDAEAVGNWDAERPAWRLCTRTTPHRSPC